MCQKYILLSYELETRNFDIVDDFQQFDNAIACGDEVLKSSPDSIVAIVNVSVPTSTDIVYRGNGFMPVNFGTLIGNEADRLRREEWPMMNHEVHR